MTVRALGDRDMVMSSQPNAAATMEPTGGNSRRSRNGLARRLATLLKYVAEQDDATWE